MSFLKHFQSSRHSETLFNKKRHWQHFDISTTRTSLIILSYKNQEYSKKWLFIYDNFFLCFIIPYKGN